MQAMVQPELTYLGTSGIIVAGEENDPSQSLMTAGKQNGSTDVSMSDSMTSHGSSDANQGVYQILDGFLLHLFVIEFSSVRFMLVSEPHICIFNKANFHKMQTEVDGNMHVLCYLH